ncbi:MAG: hypothetical protein ABR586_02260 [Thermoplasmatota archaeon]
MPASLTIGLPRDPAAAQAVVQHALAHVKSYLAEAEPDAYDPSPHSVRLRLVRHDAALALESKR